MKILQRLLTATIGASLIALQVVDAAQAVVTLASASLGPTNSGDGFTISSNQFLGWRFQLTSTFQVTAIGGNLQIGSGSIFGAIVALSGSNTLLPEQSFLPEQVLAATTLDASSGSGDVRIPLSVTLAPGNYGLVYGSGLFATTGSGIILYGNSDFPGSTYFSCSNCMSGSGTWSDSQITNTRFVVEGNAITSVPVTVPESSSALSLLGLGSLGTSYILRGGSNKQS